MRYLRYALIAVAVLALIASGLVIGGPAIVSTGIVKQRIAESIASWTGGTATLGSEPKIGLVPSFGIEVRDVQVSRRDGPSLAIPAIRASLNPLGLLMGRVEVGTVELVGSRVRMIVDQDDQAHPGDVLKRTVIGAVLLGERRPRPEAIVLRGGSIVYENRRTGASASVTGLHLRFERRPASNASVVEGSFLWRDERIDIDAELQEPEATLSGAGRRGRLTISAHPTTEPAEASQGEGFVDDLMTSGLWPPALAEHVGGSLLPGIPRGPLTVEGRIAFEGEVATLSGASVDLPGMSAEGDFVLDFSRDRPSLRGRVHTEELDLVPYIRALAPRSMPAFLAMPVSTRWVPVANVDVEVVADAVELGLARVTGVHALVTTREDRATLELRNARMGDGYAEGMIEIEGAAEGAAIRMSGRLGDAGGVDAGKLLWSVRANGLLEKNGPPEGRGEASFDLSARGDRVSRLVDTLSGTVAAELRDGSIGGADLVDTLERLAERGSVLIEDRTPFLPTPGRTRFDRIAARFHIREGVLHADRVRIAAERLEVVFAGTGGLRSGEIDAKGTASLLAEDELGRDGRPIVQLPFGIGGTIRQPIVAPGVLRGGR